MVVTRRKWILILVFSFFLGLDISAQDVEINRNQEKSIQFIESQSQRSAEMLIDIGGVISPSGKELERAKKVAAYMEAIGLSEVRIDDTPNAIGLIPGKSDSILVFISTLDDLETVAAHQQKRKTPPFINGDRVIGPGTNTSSITVAMLLAAEAVIQSGQTPEYTLLFAAVAQEETGLKGMQAIFETYHARSIGFIDVLGDGRRISYGALGIHW